MALPTASPQHSSGIALAHFSLVCAGLMWLFPFLYYVHAHPLTTFYQEWGAVVLGLCAMPLLVTQRYWQEPEIPRIVLLPIGLMLLILVQSAFGKVAYFGQALLIALYLMWAALLIMLGHRLRALLGMPALATVLSVFLVLGAELNALIGLLQHYHWHSFLDAVVVVKTGSAVYGNMAQANHFADYITLGLISLGLLRMRRQMRVWQVAVLAAPLLFVMALSGSRSPWLYLLFMTGMSLLWQRREWQGGVEDSGNPPAYPDKPYRQLLYYCLLLLLGFALMNALVQLPWFAAGTTSAQRLLEGGTGNSVRLYLWHEAWLIFTQFPLLGAGFGQFAWQHFQLGPVLQGANITGLYNNAHNLVMHLAAEMGLAGLSVLLGALGLWLVQARRDQRTIYHWWGYGLLAVLAIHSLLEYQLWYAYFLGIAAIALGMLDTTTFRLKLRGVGRLSVAVILLLGVVSMVQLMQGYRNMEGVLTMSTASTLESEATRRRNDGLIALYDKPLLHPYAELFLSSILTVSDDHLADRRTMNERAMRFVPISPVVYSEALLLALSGEQAAAQLQMERAIWSYPHAFLQVSEQLRDLAMQDPARFASLLEFALKKYEERQRAVHMG